MKNGIGLDIVLALHEFQNIPKKQLEEPLQLSKIFKTGFCQMLNTTNLILNIKSDGV
jgi:hypothetical protein